MTRKDYILIAAALKESRSHIASPNASLRDARSETLDVTVGRLAEALASDNPRFDRERFLTAAGVQS